MNRRTKHRAIIVLAAAILGFSLNACTTIPQISSSSAPALSLSTTVVPQDTRPNPSVDYYSVPQTYIAAESEPPAVITDFWFHIRKDMHLDLHLSERRVQQEINWLKRHPKYLFRLQKRLQTYLPYIYREVVLKNQPAELALLPIVESALDLYAFSHGGAAGPWQFVRGTARQYGLTIDSWYDGRRDIVASTDAALTYLEYLHGRYDDWYLALAGYNAGQGNVNRARRKNPNAGFFDLALPRETKAYVPRLLALAAVIKDPEQYGISLPEIEYVQSFDTVEIHGQFQIDKLLGASNITQEEFTKWNPAYSRWATSPKGPHHIVLPLTLDLADVQQNINNIPKADRIDWQEIQVSSGDTLSGLAQRYHTDVSSLKKINNLRNSRLRAGNHLLIPTAGATSSTPPNLAHAKTARYRVQPGDSLWTIARAHGVSLNKLMITNEIGPRDPLAVGRTLMLPGKTTNEVVRTVRYKVRKGDSLARIASKFNVSIKQIINWNSLDAKRYLQPGQGLVLHVNVVGG